MICKAVFSPVQVHGMIIVGRYGTTVGGKRNNAGCATSSTRPLLHLHRNEGMGSQIREHLGSQGSFRSCFAVLFRFCGRMAIAIVAAAGALCSSISCSQLGSTSLRKVHLIRQHRSRSSSPCMTHAQANSTDLQLFGVGGRSHCFDEYTNLRTFSL